MRLKTTPTTQFVVCLDNSDYPVSLEKGKLYQFIPDQDAAKLGYLRVIDESGEDYAYSAQRFLALELSESTVKKLRRRLTSRPKHHEARPATSSVRHRRA